MESVSLLEYISGISKTIAKNIVDYREEKDVYKRQAYDRHINTAARRDGNY